MKVNIINTDINGDLLPRDQWSYEGNPQTPLLSDGNTYTYHPAGVSGPELVGHEDNNERQTESDETWVQTSAPAAKLASKKKMKIQELKKEAFNRMEAALGIPEDAPDWIGEVVFKILNMVDKSYTRNPPLDPDLVYTGQLRTTFLDARAAINALTTVSAVESYDVVNTPVWP